jgi:hypothetical protein
MSVPYFLVYGAYGMNTYVELNPTGRWKLESGPYYKNKMFIEHKGVVFRQWISEGCIKFLPKKETIIFACDNYMQSESHISDKP